MSKNSKYPPVEEGYEIIFVAQVTHPKTGKVTRAKDLGKRAIPLKVRKDRERNKQ